MAETQQVWCEWMNENKSISRHRGTGEGTCFWTYSPGFELVLNCFPSFLSEHESVSRFFGHWFFSCPKWIITPISRVLWRCKETVSVAVDIATSLLTLLRDLSSRSLCFLGREGAKAKTSLFWVVGDETVAFGETNSGWVYSGDVPRGPFITSSLSPWG